MPNKTHSADGGTQTKNISACTTIFKGSFADRSVDYTMFTCDVRLVLPFSMDVVHKMVFPAKNHITKDTSEWSAKLQRAFGMFWKVPETIVLPENSLSLLVKAIS